MSRSDWLPLEEARKQRKRRQRERLERIDERGWLQHTRYHWFIYIEGSKLEYWPAVRRYSFHGKLHRGAFPPELLEKIEHQRSLNMKAQELAKSA